MTKEQKQRQIEIAQTIINQIQALDRMALPAYGTTKLQPLTEDKIREGGLQFKVNGLHHQGLVMIELTWLDLYNISFIRNGKVVKMVEGVYCDQLVDILDYIEKGDR